MRTSLLHAGSSDCDTVRQPAAQAGPGQPDHRVPRRPWRSCWPALFLPGHRRRRAAVRCWPRRLTALTFTTWPVQTPGDPRRPGDAARSAVRRGRRPRSRVTPDPCAFDNHCHCRRQLVVMRVAVLLAALPRAAPSPRRLRASAGGRPATAGRPWSPRSIRCSSSAERIGGDRVTVTNLDQAGRRAARPRAQPAPGRPDRRRRRWWSTCSGFQPAVDEAVEQEAPDRAFDVGTAVELLPIAADDARPRAGRASTPRRPAARTRTSGSTRSGSPRSPTRSAERLGQADPAHAADYRARAAALHARAGHAGRRVRGRPARPAQRREIVTSHAAFGYLADRYDLTRSASPGSPPRPSRRRSGWPRWPREAQAHRRHHDLLRDAGQPEGRRDHRPRGRREDRRARPARRADRAAATTTSR